MTTPKAFRVPFILGVAALALALGLDAHAQNTCNAGKVKCLAKKQLCLLKAEGVALKRGEPVDATKLQKCIDAFEDDEKGCIAKLEGRQKAEKPQTLCTETGDVAALEASVDAYWLVRFRSANVRSNAQSRATRQALPARGARDADHEPPRGIRASPIA